MSQRTRIGIVLITAALCMAVMAAHERIPQPTSYHAFADQRKLWQIPNALNVLSNVPFLFVGLLGMFATLRPGIGKRSFSSQREQWAYLVLFTGVALTAFGSSYYHWSPNNDSLVWDRLPMALGFMGLLSATISERIGVDAGVRLLIPLTLLGLLSVVLWHASEVANRGDLRFYLLVQFGSLAVVMLLVVLFQPRYSHSYLLTLAVLIYATAKVLEIADRQVFGFGRVISGHSLKHLAAAVAVLLVAVMLIERMPREQRRAAVVGG